jgi:hypothetical protein
MPPITIDPDRKEITCALARAGMTPRWIAAYLGCEESTLREALEKDETFRIRYLQSRAQMLTEQLGNIARAAAKSWRASVWLLERLFPKEYNLRKTQTEPQLDELGFTLDPEPHKPEAHKPEAPAKDSAPAPHKPEAQAKDDHQLTTDSPPDPDPLCQFLAGRAALNNPFSASQHAFHLPIHIAPVPTQ